MKNIRIILADDHAMVRQGIRKLIEANPGIIVLAEAESGRQAVELAGTLRPDVVVMDISMPLLNGLEACRQIVKMIPDCRVLMLSAYGDEAYMEQAVESGASGFLLKQSCGSILASAIADVGAGKQVFSSGIIHSHRDVNMPLRSDVPPEHRVRLTSRENEVLQLIAEGKANKETAHELSISIKTVEKHRATLMTKLNIHDTASLARYAISRGIIERKRNL